MKKGLFLVLLMIFFIFPSAVSGFEWRQLGRAPLMPEITDRLSLQEKFSFHRYEIASGINLAEPSWDSWEIVEELERAIKSDRIEEKTFPRGKKFLWMIFKPKCKISVVRNVEWQGEGNLEGFLIPIVYKDEKLNFFVAKRCGNLALIERKITPVKCEVKCKPCLCPPQYIYVSPPVYYYLPPQVCCLSPIFIPPRPTIRIWMAWPGDLVYIKQVIQRPIDPPTVRTVPVRLPVVRTR